MKGDDSNSDYETENVDFNAVIKEMDMRKKKFKQENYQENDNN